MLCMTTVLGFNWLGRPVCMSSYHDALGTIGIGKSVIVGVATPVIADPSSDAVNRG